MSTDVGTNILIYKVLDAKVISYENLKKVL